MFFCSQQFLVFTSAVFVLHWLLPRQSYRVWLLLAASLYFYASWNKWLAAIICLSTAMDYAVARAMEASSTPRLRHR